MMIFRIVGILIKMIIMMSDDNKYLRQKKKEYKKNVTSNV